MGQQHDYICTQRAYFRNVSFTGFRTGTCLIRSKNSGRDHIGCVLRSYAHHADLYTVSLQQHIGLYAGKQAAGILSGDVGAEHGEGSGGYGVFQKGFAVIKLMVAQSHGSGAQQFHTPDHRLPTPVGRGNFVSCGKQQGTLGVLPLQGAHKGTECPETRLVPGGLVPGGKVCVSQNIYGDAGHGITLSDRPG